MAAEPSSKRRTGAETRAALLVAAIFAGLAVFTIAYIVVQQNAGRTDLASNLVEGLAFSFISLAVLALVGPIATELFEELIVKEGRSPRSCGRPGCAR